MAKDRMAVLAAMMEQGVIPVFYHPDVEVCTNVIQACANGGAKCIEFTNRGDFAAHVFLDVTRHFAKADKSVIMGVGSVVDAPTAGIYIANGANFVVGPVLNPDVAKVCNRRKIPYSPGCGSASEIGFAEELGVRDRQDLPRHAGGRAGVRQGRAGPHAVDQASCRRAASIRPRNRWRNGSARASWRRHRLQADHPASCSRPRTMPASRRRCRDHRPHQENPWESENG